MDDDAPAPTRDELVEALFARFPGWRRAARDEGKPRWSPSAVVEVPAPAEADAKWGLIIEIDEEITVHFDWWHDHYDPGSTYATDPPTEEGIPGMELALQVVEAILAERLAVVSYFAGDQWCGSSLMAAGEIPPTDAIYGSLRANRAPSFNRVRVRSWKGTLNADLGRSSGAS